MSPAEIRSLRRRLGNPSRAEFAWRFGLEEQTLVNWEHGRRKPAAAAITLLRLIERAPDIIEELVAQIGR